MHSPDGGMSPMPTRDTSTGGDSSYGDLDPATVAVRDMVGASRELVGRMADRMGMNPNDMAAIAALAQRGPMGVAELAAHLGIRSASATVLVDRLERAGHVRRVRDTVDRRRVSVVETPAARQATHAAWSATISRIDDVCRALPDDEREVVLRFLSDITEVTADSGND
ncbi:MarR family winged helix-turn-helix transcriptional regulator [Williamsia herbipolensis]|uniref:MarR family winged helix-turn-helix transcriptional regulator n=1 Tax=Williamsia herbipolensis TaxID=1603258 RepID=UPI0009E5CD47|nr:MarR family winged helix-turn-helix transcriptional regulator [Williamsia herbipolensis]